MKRYPFTALVGQEDLKLSLLLASINPSIGGVLLRGEKGTAKSTAVRAVADILPEIDVITGCGFSCDPNDVNGLCAECLERELQIEQRKIRIITLPLNATEDRVAGGIDFSKTIQEGQIAFQSGLLADAHRGFLYIDEVNLLDDHIIDLILDASSSGINTVEREGVSITHPSRFILIGTMNPEEGELRPQLLDRFGLCVEVTGNEEIAERVELLKRQEAFDHNQNGFIRQFHDKNEQLKTKIRRGRKVLSEIRILPQMRSFIAEFCTQNHVAGHRADLVMEQAALALAALEGAKQVENEHILRVSSMVLIHRSREAEPLPPEPPQQQTQNNKKDDPQEKQEQTDKNTQQENEDTQKPFQGNSADSQPEPQQSEKEKSSSTNSQEQMFEIGQVFPVQKISTMKDSQIRRGSGRRSHSRVAQKQGRYSRSSCHGLPGDIALDATIRAAAPWQVFRKGELALNLLPEDFRYKIREKRIGNLLLFIVDASGSMGARGRMAASKGAVMSLLLDAYQKRDKVAMVSFRRDRADLNLPITGSVELAGKQLADMAIGGRTPLSAGLLKGFEVMRNYLVREPTGRPIVIILTDGKTNVSQGNSKPVDEMKTFAATMTNEKRAKYIVVDTEEAGIVNFQLARELAGDLDADYFKIEDIQAEELVQLVREQQ